MDFDDLDGASVRGATEPRRAMRGRPSGLMTRRRRQLLKAYRALAAEGGHISTCRLARECGLYDFRDAKRIVEDLKRMGKL